MLIHKETMGVLNRIWTGVSKNYMGHLTPITVDANFCTLPELNRHEWWEVRPGSSLAIKAIRNYPDMAPVLDDSGHLVDIYPFPTSKPSLSSVPPEYQKQLAEEALRRGYRNMHSLRPKGIMPFLDDEERMDVSRHTQCDHFNRRR